MYTLITCTLSPINMPPKKKKGVAKKGNKKNDNADGIDLLPEDRIKLMEAKSQVLELQLVQRSEATNDALAECESMQKQLADNNQKHEEDKQMSSDVARAMTRQYKGMQEDLLNKINERERTINNLRDEIETLKALHKEQLAQKDTIIQEKDVDIEQHKFETEALCKHFSSLLSVLRLKMVKNVSKRPCEEDEMVDT